MKKYYILEVETEEFRSIIDRNDKDKILIDENIFHNIFREDIKDQIQKLILEEWIEKHWLSFPTEWNKLKDMVKVKFKLMDSMYCHNCGIVPKNECNVDCNGFGHNCDYRGKNKDTVRYSCYNIKEQHDEYQKRALEAIERRNMNE